MKQKKILFMCKYNAFRSRIAEEYFNKINTNQKIKAYSRGFIPGEDSDGIQKRMVKSLLGVSISKRKPIGVNIKDLKSADLIVVVADDVPKIMFNYPYVVLNKKMIFWKVKDEQYGKKENIKKIILEIKRKVDVLNRQLKKENKK
jgi:protein-tyrosine-phosphatase